MKRAIKRLPFGILFCIIALIMSANNLQAQNELEDSIQQLNSETVTGYLQPFLDGFGANLNSGFTGTAKIENKLVIRLEAVAMATLIGSAEETYSVLPPSPFSQQPVETATIFGDQGATITGPEGLQYKFQNGVFNLDYFPLAVPQLTIGNFYHTQFQIRYAGYSGGDDVPEIQLIGLGVRHGLNQYLNDLPVDLAAGISYQQLDIGDIMQSRAYAVTGMASKEFSLLTVYGGIQYEKTQLDLNYTYTGASDSENAEIDLSFDGKNTLRGFAGLGLNLAFVHIRADINLGNVTVLSASIGFGI